MRSRAPIAMASIATLLLMLLAGVSAKPATPSSSSVNVELRVEWIVHSNASPSADMANAVCERGEYVYVAGVDRSIDTGQFRVEKRLKSNGELVKAWTYNPSMVWDELHDCINVGDLLYAVGRAKAPGHIFAWAIVVLDLDLNMLNYTVYTIPGIPPESVAGRAIAESIASDGEYLYIAGSDNSPGLGDDQWRVEKRRL